MATASKPARSARHAGAMKLATHEPEEMHDRQLAQLRYDYEQIDAAHRHQVQEAAVQIRRDTEATQRSIIAVGKRLEEVKKLLPHGQFTAWIEAEFEWAERTAQGFMTIAREYGGDEQRMAVASMFSTGALMVLAAPSTPPEVRAEMEARAETTGLAPTREEIRNALRESRGESVVEVEVVDETPYATVVELQMIVSDWVRGAFWSHDAEIKELERIVADGGNARVPGLLERLTPERGVAAFRVEDVQQAVRVVLAARLRQKATRDAVPMPPPPPPPAPSSWQMTEPIATWLKVRAKTVREQHELLAAIMQQETNHPDYAALTAVLPERWGLRAFDKAMKDVLESLAQKIGESEWEARQLPSGNWYAINKGRWPKATARFATREEAMAHRGEVNSDHANFYSTLHDLLTKAEDWLTNGIRQIEIGDLFEVYAALEARSRQPDPPPFIATRLQRVIERIEAAHQLVAMFTPSHDGVIVVIDRAVAEKLRGAAVAMELRPLTLVEQATLDDVLARALGTEG